MCCGRRIRGGCAEMKSVAITRRRESLKIRDLKIISGFLSFTYFAVCGLKPNQTANHELKKTVPSIKPQYGVMRSKYFAVWSGAKRVNRFGAHPYLWVSDALYNDSYQMLAQIPLFSSSPSIYLSLNLSSLFGF